MFEEHQIAWQALARIQTLKLDALDPFTELLELISKEKEITSDQVGYTVESAITLLSNASAHMSTLHWQKVLMSTNRDLLSFAQGREAQFLTAALQPFGLKLTGDATEHLEQLAVLQKVKAFTMSPNPSGFGKLSLPKPGNKDPTHPDSDCLSMLDQPGIWASRRDQRIPNNY